MLKRKPELLHFTVLFFLVFLTYQESLNNYFLADDPTWLEQAIKTESHFVNIFQPVARFFRPIVTFTYYVIYKFFHLNPAPYYFFCMVLHFVNCIVLYYFCLAFFRVAHGRKEKTTAFLSAVLFSVLYSHCEAVILVGAIGDSFLLLFCLLSFIFFMKSLNKAALSAYAFLSLTFYSFSLLSKETAFVFPILLFAFRAVFKKGNYNRIFPYIFLTLVYVVFYKMITPSMYFLNAESMAFIIPSLLKAFKIMIVSLLGFGSNLLWILDDVNAQLYTPKMILRYIAMGGFVLYLHVYLKQKNFHLCFSANTKKILIFFICFIVIAYLPVAVHVKLEKAATDISQTSLRYFYFPDAGFCVLIAFVLCKLFQFYRNFILESVLIVSLISVNIISVYQTEWSYNFIGETRKYIVDRVVSLHAGHKMHPHILLINYPPGQFSLHLQPSGLSGLFPLYRKNAYFITKATAYHKVKNLNLNQVCFFEWVNVTFVDKTAEYVHAIEKQRQQERLKAYRKIQSE